MAKFPVYQRNTIDDAFRRAVRKWRGREAVRFEDRAWSFDQLDQAASNLAEVLAARGLRKGDRVGGFGRNSDAYLILWLACARAGFVHVPLNFGLTPRELAYILGQSGARAIFTDEDTVGSFDAMDETPAGLIHGSLTDPTNDLCALTIALNGSGDRDRIWDVDDLDYAQILYTSGTTGLPKGGAMTHRALNTMYFSAIHDLDYILHDIVLAALPLYHSGQLHTFVMPAIFVGARLIILRSPEPSGVFAVVRKHKVNSFFAPATVWVSLLRNDGFTSEAMGSLRKVYYGASIMPVPVIQEMRERLPGVEFYNCYGQSEVGPLATVLRPEEHDDRPSSAGRPVLGVESRIVDEQMSDVPPGTVGEIVHRSPQLIDCYWGNEEATAEAFQGGWFHSGDLGYVDQDGYLFIVDRVKDMINTGGVLVASREVEDVLFTHPAVHEVAVIGLPDQKWLEIVCGVVILRAGGAVDEAELIAHAKANLAHYKVPKKIFFTTEFPKNASGKILKRSLRLTYGGTEAAFVSEAPKPAA